MIKRSFFIISAIMVLSLTSCLKETYNMKMLSKQAHLSPTLAISAVTGDVSFADAVKSNDTIEFDQNNFITLVFRQNSVVNLKLTDFSKGPVIQRTAVIDPTTIDLNLHDFLRHITGDFQFLNPSIKFTYTNSFQDSVKLSLIASGQNKDRSAPLNVLPFYVIKPNLPVQQEVTATYLIDKNNSNLKNLVSLPPETISFSGTATLTTSTKRDPAGENLLSPDHLVGSVEVDVPLDMTINNLQYTDTVDNFMRDKGNNNNPMSPEDFQFLRINLSAKNGFPLGVSVKISLYDSGTMSVKSTVDATGILLPAPVDSNGKASGVTESTATIELTRDFFSLVNTADMIIFRFSFNTSGNGSQEVKIYSDYRINFKASLVFKPDINLN
jgi:hypothetical protein